MKKILFGTIGWARVCINRFAFKLSGRLHSNQQDLGALRNKYLGKRCFIVCNGPSLNPDDLTRIHENGDISFATNKIDKIFSKTPWRPTYYLVFDNSFQRTLLSTMRNMECVCQFYRTDSYLTTRQIKNHKVLWLNTDGNRKYLESPKFSEDLVDIVYAIATVTYISLQLAVYLGFKEIYIIGCDNSYGIEKLKDGTIINHNKTSYFEGSDKKDSAKIVGETWQMNIAYEYARKYADENGIKIFNATRGGYLEAFERVNFDKLFS